MEYMILIHGDETNAAPAPGTPGFDEMMATFMAYNQKLIDGGHWVSGANLQPTSTATTLKKEWGGETTVIDGPFAETKEQLAGYYLISASDLDEAIELAKALPIPAGSIEVRPVAFRPDAG
jgi:hypothetical protein